ncbi:hypothetical protein F9C07_2264573 [Aspergillus flavus]|uniref:F-box domain-containing protein n=1 Tax=Aspergillus flavus (strain ATCC 200026 / FGSC A1120 / IAM 13836 / NRRL 3357 / JCM 12722 / SRRC 167) TaxID=332952 RepID=A0A7U2N099_ASPFN|nr:hypothetical protein F9C07_2264573 [Aspergillus flavus]GMF68032.1 unnamed protein product [Aspergillus oryzae]GMF83931.1 unnamed protein product [Aspergillus oryzae]
MLSAIMTPFLGAKIRSFLRLFRRKSKPIPPPTQQEVQDIYIPPPPPQELQDIFIPPLLNLPLDILFEIFPLLPLPSQVCLALSCKPLYRLFSSTLQDEQLAWPRLLACKTFRISDTLSSNEAPLISPRTQVLLQLQDDWWLYCAACLKIQPRALFWPGIESLPLRSQKCIFGARVIDLCSCLSLTYFDRIRLERWLYTGRTDTLSQRIREAFQPLIIDDRSSLLHQCSIPSIPEVSVDLEIVVALNDRKRLEALTRYRVRMSSYQPRPRGVIPWFSGPHDATERIYLCPHIDLLPFVRDSYYWPQIECWSCETSVCVDSSEDEGLHVVLLSVRNLGEPHYREGLHLPWEKIARENSHDITGAMIADMANVYGTSPLWGQVYSAWNRRRLLEPQVSRDT